MSQGFSRERGQARAAASVITSQRAAGWPGSKSCLMMTTRLAARDIHWQRVISYWQVARRVVITFV